MCKLKISLSKAYFSSLVNKKKNKKKKNSFQLRGPKLFFSKSLPKKRAKAPFLFGFGSNNCVLFPLDGKTNSFYKFIKPYENKFKSNHGECLNTIFSILLGPSDLLWLRGQKIHSISECFIILTLSNTRCRKNCHSCNATAQSKHMDRLRIKTDPILTAITLLLRLFGAEIFPLYFRSVNLHLFLSFSLTSKYWPCW
jgi:hypothetical protein